MHFLEIRSKVKNHHISEARVSFENIVWSVYQDMGWRTHFLHMATNNRLKASLTFKRMTENLIADFSYSIPLATYL